MKSNVLPLKHQLLMDLLKQQKNDLLLVQNLVMKIQYLKEENILILI